MLRTFFLLKKERINFSPIFSLVSRRNFPKFILYKKKQVNKKLLNVSVNLYNLNMYFIYSIVINDITGIKKLTNNVLCFHDFKIQILKPKTQTLKEICSVNIKSVRFNQDSEFHNFLYIYYVTIISSFRIKVEHFQ